MIRHCEADGSLGLLLESEGYRLNCRIDDMRVRERWHIFFTLVAADAADKTRCILPLTVDMLPRELIAVVAEIATNVGQRKVAHGLRETRGHLQVLIDKGLITLGINAHGYPDVRTNCDTLGDESH